jgi:hypothetical protein
MKKLLAALLVSVMAFGGAGLASAAKGGNSAGPSENSQKGLCTAYFNGQKNGHDKNGEPGPFVDLGQDAGDGSDEGDTVGDPADIWEFCDGLIMGQPSHGRYTCYIDDMETESTEDDQATCDENPAPGNS